MKKVKLVPVNDGRNTVTEDNNLTIVEVNKGCGTVAKLRFCPSLLNDAYIILVNNKIFPSMEVTRELKGETLTGLKVEECGLIFNERAEEIRRLLPGYDIKANKPFIYIKPF